MIANPPDDFSHGLDYEDEDAYRAMATGLFRDAKHPPPRAAHPCRAYEDGPREIRDGTLANWCTVCHWEYGAHRGSNP